MSISVTIDELPAAIDKQIGWCYLLTTSDEGLPRILAIAPDWTVDRAALQAEISAGTAKSVIARPTVTLVYPPRAAEGFSLIVDGAGSVDGPVLTFTPAKAVMHRPAVGRSIRDQ